MRSIPFGYQIKDGSAVADENEGPTVKRAFELYLGGDSLAGIARELEIDRYHRGISNLLKDQRYLGTDFYPQLIDQDLFEKVQEVRKKRLTEHARPQRVRKQLTIPEKFTLGKVTRRFSDPFSQAQYIYSLINEKE